MANHKYTYKVIEDNGGGLALYIFWGERVVYSHSGYEYNSGQLTQDLIELDAGTDVGDWEGCEEDPQGNWDAYDRYEYGWKVVAIGGGGKRKLYKAQMGRAAQIEFDVSEEETEIAQVASTLGSRGGSRTSERKAQAARDNGRKGGRPRKS